MSSFLKYTFASFVAAAVFTAPLSAELKYTMTIEAHKSPASSTTMSNPMFGLIGGLIVEAIAPEGGLETTVTVGEHGTRVDYGKGAPFMPGGGVTLVRPDGSMVVLNDADKTYWTIVNPIATVLGQGMGQAKTTVTHTGEYETIAGVKAERVTFEVHAPLPLPAGVPVSAGMPKEFVLHGETWLASQYAAYAKMTASLGGLAAMGFSDLAAQGFMMRSTVQGDILGDQEIESRVTAISEAPVPASEFEIPAGYHERPAPLSFPGAAPSSK